MQPTDANVEHVYDEIAEGYYHAHQNPRIIDVEKYAKLWGHGKLLDIGCGAGANTIAFAKQGFDCVGIDFSSKQLFWASKNMKKNNVNFPIIKANCLSLPFRDNTFDFVVSTAVFHHFDSEEKRTKALKEAYRVLRPNGVALITAWNKKQRRFILGPRDIYVPWKIGDKIHQRYYHLFTYGEMKKLAEKAGFKSITLFPEYQFKLPIFKTFSRNVCMTAIKEI
ncbi:MAG: class I SAM-dependent methyltransferase [Candidatus Aenigmatarchaeota archaeon]